jgi:hypothetical protein
MAELGPANCVFSQGDPIGGGNRALRRQNASSGASCHSVGANELGYRRLRIHLGHDLARSLVEHLLPPLLSECRWAVVIWLTNLADATMEVRGVSSSNKARRHFRFLPALLGEHQVMEPL